MELDMVQAVTEIGAGLGFGGGEAAPEPEPAPSPEPDNSGEGAPTTEPTPAPAPEPAPAPGAPAPAPGAPAPAPAAGPVPSPAPSPGAPSTWRPEAQAKWASIDPTVQQEILKREEDAMRGIGQYRQSAQFGETVNKLLAPHLPLLKQHNVDPVQNMGQLLQLQHSLATGTEGDRLEVLRTIAQAYNINLAHLDPSAAPYIDPAVEGLQREIQALKSQLQTVQGAKVEEARTALRSEIDAFATNPANVYFNEVGGTMAQLLQSGQAQSLQEAYETAIWMVPAVRAKETQRLAAEAQKSSEAAAAETAAAAAAKTAAARKAAGVNVKVGATSAKGDGTSSTKRATIDETLAATLAEINARG